MTHQVLRALESVWEKADVGVARAGDLVIERYESRVDGEHGYTIFRSCVRYEDEHPDIRILEPAEPDWTQAPAVLAKAGDDEEPRVYTKRWDGAEYVWAARTFDVAWTDLRNVTPLWPEGEKPGSDA